MRASGPIRATARDEIDDDGNRPEQHGDPERAAAAMARDAPVERPQDSPAEEHVDGDDAQKEWGEHC